MQQEVFSGLKKIPFLAQLSDDALYALAAKAKPTSFLKHATIITEGDTTNSLYILLSGKVRVFTSGDRSREVTLFVQESGSCFGEIALLSDEPRSASVEALEKTQCGVISKHDFIQWLTLHPEVTTNLLVMLSEKVRSLTQKVKQLALSNVYQRTINVLLEMARPHDDILVIENKPTQYEIATIIGSSREMVNKVWKQLEMGEYIVVEGKLLKIIKKLPTDW